MRSEPDVRGRQGESEDGRRAIRVMTILAFLVIGGAAVFFAALLGLNVSNHAYYTDTIWGILYHFALPAALSVAALAALRLPADGRLALAFCLLAVVPALYATEAYLGFRAQSLPAEAAGRFDQRSKLDVILDLRRQGVDAYPSMRAKSMLVEAADGTLAPAIGGKGGGLLPLANLPRKRTVVCNETGRWLVYDSDEYGFHNPPGAWSARPPRVALVGDSFTHGSCVASDKNIAAHLGRRFGGVLNLGISGFGPLSELAAIKEYLVQPKPRVVAWLYFEGNDLFQDLSTERRSELMMRYLKDGFSQQLMVRRDEVSTRFKAYLDAKLTEAMGRVDDPYEAMVDFLQLYYLRENFGLDPVGLGIGNPVSEDDYRLFKDILVEARRTVESWGGRFVFVYMPDSPRYFASARNSRIRDRVRDRVLAIADGLGLPIIDIDATFAVQPDPRALFVFPGSHYNEAGYRLAADAIAAAIEETRRP